MNYLKWFGRNKNDNTPAVQTASGRSDSTPFGLIMNCRLPSFEKSLYRSLREAIPVIDAAIYKTVRLVGGFKVYCSKNAQSELDDFMKNVKVNGISNGIDSFLSIYLEQLLTYGTAVGEIVMGYDGGIAALYNSSLDDVVENG